MIGGSGGGVLPCCVTGFYRPLGPPRGWAQVPGWCKISLPKLLAKCIRICLGRLWMKRRVISYVLFAKRSCASYLLRLKKMTNCCLFYKNPGKKILPGDFSSLNLHMKDVFFFVLIFCHNLMTVSIPCLRCLDQNIFLYKLTLLTIKA